MRSACLGSLPSPPYRCGSGKDAVEYSRIDQPNELLVVDTRARSSNLQVYPIRHPKNYSMATHNFAPR